MEGTLEEAVETGFIAVHEVELGSGGKAGERGGDAAGLAGGGIGVGEGVLGGALQAGGGLGSMGMRAVGAGGKNSPYR